MIRNRLFAVLLFALTCMTVSAWEGDFTVDNIIYRIRSVASRSVSVCGTTPNDDGMYRIPENVTYEGVTFTVDYIVLSAFTDSYVSGVSIPASVTELGEGAFFFFANNQTLETLIIEDSPEVLDCTALRSVDNLELGQFSRTIIRDLYLGRDLTYIPFSQYRRDYLPFLGVNTMEQITVGQYVTDMSCLDNSVEFCSNLKSITFNCSVPPTAPYFKELQKITVKLYVPKGSLDAYKAAPVWKEFVNISEIDSDIAIVNVDYNKDLGSVFTGRIFVEDDIRIDKGEDLTLTIIPNTDCEVLSIMVDGTEQIQNLNGYTFTLGSVSADTHIQIEFGAPRREVCLKTQDGGSFVLSVDYGGSITIDLRADDEWYLKSVSVNGIDYTSKVVAGKLTLTDVVTDMLVMPLYEPFNPDNTSKQEDVNGDGFVDTSDVMSIYKYMQEH